MYGLNLAVTIIIEWKKGYSANERLLVIRLQLVLSLFHFEGHLKLASDLHLITFNIVSVFLTTLCLFFLLVIYTHNVFSSYAKVDQVLCLSTHTHEPIKSKKKVI